MSNEDGDLASQSPYTRPFEIRTRREGERIVAHLIGELDGRTAFPFHHLISMVNRESASELVLNLGRLRFIDKAGQREVLLLWQRAAADAFGFRLVGASGYVRESFRTTGVDRVVALA